MHRISKKCLIVAGVLLLAACCLPSTAYCQSATGVKGTVRNMGGVGVPRATVTARQNHTDLKSVTANEKGYFVLDGLEAGKYDFAFDAPGYGLGVLYNVEVKQGKVRDLGSGLMLSTDRGSQYFIRGVVFFKDGTSIEGAQVDLYSVNSDGSARKITTGFTNDMGEFGFVQSKGAKKFRVRATFNGVTGEKDVETEMPAVYRLAISLDTTRRQK